MSSSHMYDHPVMVCVKSYFGGRCLWTAGCLWISRALSIYWPWSRWNCKVRTIPQQDVRVSLNNVDRHGNSLRFIFDPFCRSGQHAFQCYSLPSQSNSGDDNGNRVDRWNLWQHSTECRQFAVYMFIIWLQTLVDFTDTEYLTHARVGMTSPFWAVLARAGHAFLAGFGANGADFGSSNAHHGVEGWAYFYR